MILSKEIAVRLNLAACKFKQYTASMLRKNNIDLTPEQFLTIDILWNLGAMSQTALAEEMGKDKNSVTKLVDALEKKDLVVRQKDRRDRRSNTIILTRKAEQMKDNAKKFGVSMLDGLLVGIDEKELRAFLSTLEKISGAMG
ncbi:MAG: MarR family transcriptional regulator [Bacteroidales bacterium]|nr:MarR family transcriptional regulator [Bacteroidales bacterium]